MQPLPLILAFALSLILAGPAFAFDLFMPAPTAAPGSSVILNLTFSGMADSLAALQFDLDYDASSMSLVPMVGEAARTSGKSLFSAELAAGKRRFLVFGLNQTVIADGVLVRLFVNVSPEAANADFPMRLANILGADPSGKAITSGAYSGFVSIRGAAGQGSSLRTEGVLNAASLLAGPVSPGQIVTLIGSRIGPLSATTPVEGPTSIALGGTAVVFDGSPAPLLYADPNQINLVVPYAVAGRSSSRLEIRREGEAVAAISVPVTESAPAIFTLEASGGGPGAVLNQDSSVNSGDNLANVGDVVALYATGAGLMTASRLDGQVISGPPAFPLLPVAVRIGEVQAEVLYAGDAPGLVSGLIQVNCRVPDGAPRGLSIALLMTVGQQTSQRGVTMAIR